MIIPVYSFGLIAFVKHPNLRGLYIKTHVCVTMADCSFCKSKINEPCQNHHKEYCSFTHAARRIDAAKMVGGKK